MPGKRDTLPIIGVTGQQGGTSIVASTNSQNLPQYELFQQIITDDENQAVSIQPVSEGDDILNILKIHKTFCTIPAKLVAHNGKWISLEALIDSGATANFIDSTLLEEVKHTLRPDFCPPVRDAKYRILAPGGDRLSCDVDLQAPQMANTTTTVLRIMELETAKLILGLPWLQLHNPSVDWTSGTLTLRNTELLETAMDEAVQALEFLNLTENMDNEEGGESCEFLALIGALAPTAAKPPGTLPDRYQDLSYVFSKDEAEKLPPHRPGLDHDFTLKPGTKPPFGPIYNLSEEELKALREYIDKMLELGFIRVSKSPAGSPMLWVRKKDGTLRPCVDYRGLNAITIPNRYPIPLISEILNRLSTAIVFTKLDLRGAYNLIRIKEGMEWMTAFRTRFGSFEYLVLPFGLRNAPATFQSYIDSCLRPYLDHFVVVYLDDILIYSGDVNAHTDQVRQVLQSLGEWGLFCKLEKCEFDVTSVEFLGYIISPQGIQMDPARLATIREWPAPGALREMQSFLGFCNFYRRFIHKYSFVAMGMTNLTKGKQVFQWNRAAESSFQDLKSKFEAAPILIHFLPQKKSWLECDASGYALAGIISQRGDDNHLHPIAFYSRKFIAAEINYTTFDQELLAIVESVKHWRHYLEGAQHTVTILSDHNNLRYFMTTRTLTRRQARWAITLSTIDFEIVHRPGSKNPADGPSRRPDYIAGAPEEQQAILPMTNEVDNLVLLHGEEDIMHLMLSVAKEQLYAVFISVLDELSEVSTHLTEETPGTEVDLQSEIKSAQGRYPAPQGIDFVLVDGLWTHKGSQLWIPPDEKLKMALFREFHDSPIAGHFGRDKTVLALKRMFFWTGMDADVEDYVLSCLACQRNKPDRIKTSGELAPLPVPGRPWGSIAMDMITDLPNSKRTADLGDGNSSPTYDSIMVVVCRLTKEARFVAVRKDMSSKQFAHLFIEVVFTPHGMPDDITTDRGSLFTSQLWETFMKFVGTKRKLSTAFHPQTDGQTERMNAVLECYLRMYADFDQTNWGDLLDLAEYAWNNSVSATTKLTPFEANGKIIRPFQMKSLEKFSSQAGHDLAANLKVTLQDLKETLTHAQNLQAKYYDEHHKPVTFKVGDQVMLSTRNLSSNRPSKKLGPKKAGPFRIDKVLGTQAYRLKLPTTWKCHNTFHVSLLTAYRRATRVEREEEIDNQGPELVLNDYGNEEEEWEIESIVDSKIKGRWRKLYYLVKWKGWTDDHNTWIRQEDLEHAQEAVESFHTNYPHKPRANVE